jgi:hypothetical protein
LVEAAEFSGVRKTKAPMFMAPHWPISASSLASTLQVICMYMLMSSCYAGRSMA